MRRILSIATLLLLSLSMLPAQETFRVMFYNCENFFDTKDNPSKNDNDFLPNSTHFWSLTRYKEKQRNIAKVITAVGGWETPTLVGLCEVENDSVIYDLTHYSPLRGLNYKYVVTNSPDYRGINVALLYQREQFKLITATSHRIRLPRPTRDILHVTGKVRSGDTIDVFVCHFPSRLGGEKETETLRITAAETLKKKADSIQSIRTNPKILIMGDFNDYPDCRSLQETLGAKASGDKSAKYINLMFPYLNKNGIGSHKYEAEWGVLDQIIVNKNLFKEVKKGKANIFNDDFLLQDDTRYGGKRPFRTYAGFKYIGGFSDHLPVWADLDFEKK